MVKISGGILWAIKDILSGRRKHWNSICTPVFIKLFKESIGIQNQLRKSFQLILSSSWTMFRSDFSQGYFIRWQKSIDEEKTKKLLAIYISYLIQVCSARGIWENINLSDDQIWNTFAQLIPEVDEFRQYIYDLCGEKLAEELSRVYIDIFNALNIQIDLNMCTSEGIDISESTIFLKLYHPKLFIDISKRIACALS